MEIVLGPLVVFVLAAVGWSIGELMYKELMRASGNTERPNRIELDHTAGHTWEWGDHLGPRKVEAVSPPKIEGAVLTSEVGTPSYVRPGASSLRNFMYHRDGLGGLQAEVFRPSERVSESGFSAATYLAEDRVRRKVAKVRGRMV